jgi:hypothetical protein
MQWFPNEERANAPQSIHMADLSPNLTEIFLKSLVVGVGEHTLLGEVTHACNPSYLGGKDYKDHGPMPSLAKSETPVSTNKKLGMGWGLGSSGKAPA